jgi:hypothetical protein
MQIFVVGSVCLLQMVLPGVSTLCWVRAGDGTTLHCVRQRSSLCYERRGVATGCGLTAAGCVRLGYFLAKTSLFLRVLVRLARPVWFPHLAATLCAASCVGRSMDVVAMLVLRRSWDGLTRSEAFWWATAVCAGKLGREVPLGLSGDRWAARPDPLTTCCPQRSQ